MMQLIIWDVQHGSAAYLRTPSNKHIAIDLGAGRYSNTTFSPLLYLKNKCGVDRLDEVIITHPHTDHIDDIMNFGTLSPRVLLRPNHLSENDIRNANQKRDGEKLDKYFLINEEYSLPIGISEDPKRPENNGGVQIQTFHPTKCAASNINNHSIVSVIQYLNTKILFPGDNEADSWKELLGEPSFVEAIKDTDIFVASHHGRNSGYCADLFKHFKPKLTIISDGPLSNTSVTDKYDQQTTGLNVYSRSEGASISHRRKCLTTRQDGTIIISVDKNRQNKDMNVTIK